MTKSLIGDDTALVIAKSDHWVGANAHIRRYAARLPPEAAGKWCRFTIFIEAASPVWAKLELADSARGQVVREAFFPSAPLPPRGSRRAEPLRPLLLHVPGAAGALTLTLFARGADQSPPILHAAILRRHSAAARLLANGIKTLPAAMRGRPAGILGRLRALLGQRAARRGAAPPYDMWIDLFDCWMEAERLALAAKLPASGPAVDVAIIGGVSKEALAATLASVAAQWGTAGPTPRPIVERQDWLALRAPWLVILEAGEILAPHAIACFMLAASRSPQATAFCADTDHIGPDGTRSAPRLAPPPDPWLLRSEFCADGAWMFSRPAIAAFLQDLPATAGKARLALARGLPQQGLHRVPLILAHRPIIGPTSESLQPYPAACAATSDDTPLVSIIIPSACRSRHVLRCLHQLVRRTEYPAFEILLAVSAVDPSDPVQSACLRRAGALPHVRVIALDMPAFNFSAVNNQASVHAKGEYLLLLNDDVVPVDPSWVGKMVAFVCDGAADLVGARLLYGNGMVQHGGVIIGLANLCEHAFRLAERTDAGPHGLGRLDRQVSAITAACMLVRSSLFESLGGFDEAFAIALNDVDFCLRAGAAGARIVFAASVELYHFESLSLGRHYAGPRAALEAQEVSRFRQRWASVIAADPFYHPCASLEPGREFQPGFPPRQTPLSWIGQEPLALH